MSRAADLAALIVDVNTTEAKIDELTGKTTAGSIAVTGEGGSTTTNLQQGLTKGWTRFAGSATVSDSLNTSSITDRATGKYQMNHSNNMGNANYVVHWDHGQTSYTTIDGKLGNYYDHPNIATNEYHVMIHSSSSFYDATVCCCSMVGDLA